MCVKSSIISATRNLKAMILGQFSDKLGRPVRILYYISEITMCKQAMMFYHLKTRRCVSTVHL